VLRPFPDGDRVLLSCEVGNLRRHEGRSLADLSGERRKRNRSVIRTPRCRATARSSRSDARTAPTSSIDGTERVLALRRESIPASEYPHMAGFHDERGLTSRCARVIFRGAPRSVWISSTSVPKRRTVAPKTKVFRASGSQGDKGSILLDAPRWVWSSFRAKRDSSWAIAADTSGTRMNPFSRGRMDHTPTRCVEQIGASCSLAIPRHGTLSSSCHRSSFRHRGA